MKYEMDGKTKSGHWELNGTAFDGEDEERVRDDIWEYVKENIDLDEEINDAIDEQYNSASDLFNHMDMGYDTDDIRTEALDNIHDNLDTPEAGEDYDIAGETAYWVDDEEEDPLEVEKSALEDKISEVVTLRNSLENAHNTVYRGALKGTELDVPFLSQTLNGAYAVIKVGIEECTDYLLRLNTELGDLEKRIEEKKNEPKTEEQPTEAPSE